MASLISEETPDALIATACDDRVTYWNPAAEDMFGYGADEALGRALRDLVWPLPQPLTDGMLQWGDAEHGPLHQLEAVRRCKDGGLIYVHASTRAMRGNDGSLQGYVHSHTDITQLKVQREARHIESRFQGLLESTPDAIVIVNDIGRIVFVNGQAEAVFGYSRSELVGQLLEMLMPARYRSAHQGHRTGYLAQSRTRPMGRGLQLHGLRKGGEEFPVEISLSPLQTDVGRMGMSAIRDITDRRRFEQALHEKNLELERANQAKDRFLATMSHELRTPLNAVIGFTGVLLMKLPGPLTVEQEKQLTMVQSSARHLLSLINDLLDLAKIESGKVEVHFSEVPCRPLVEEVAATLRPAAEAKGLRLLARLPAHEVVLHTDRRAVQQVLLNLANNAIKFTPHGQVEVALEPGAVAGEMELSVTDTGVGIAADDQLRLFQPFTQVGAAAAAQRAEGTGLGLYLCRKLAELLGGRIVLDSAPGRGSRFALALPLRRAGAPAGAPGHAAEADPAKAMP